MQAAQQLTGYLRVYRSLAGFLSKDERLLREWHRELRTERRLHESLTGKWAAQRRLPLRRVGGNIGVYNEVLYLFVRAARPKIMVETGVAYGFSSAYILQALSDNGVGELYSIDLPNTNPEGYVSEGGFIDHTFVASEELTGLVVPDALRDRWHLGLGSSRQLLPNLLSELGSIDIFFHDSDHSKQNVTFELTEAWSHLVPGGVVISDDIPVSDAFDSFCGRYGSTPFRWFGPRGRMGAFYKPTTGVRL